MEDIDRFIAEIIRIRRCIQVFVELFIEKESLKILTDVSSEVFAIMQRSMHDEILISLSRIYDGKNYRYKQEDRENLSQINLVSRYESFLTYDLKALRAETKGLVERISIKCYRDWKVAHNDKDTLLGKRGIIKHNIDSDAVISLLNVSLQLAIGIKAQVEQKETVTVPVMITDVYEGKGKVLIEKLRVLRTARQIPTIKYDR